MKKNSQYFATNCVHAGQEPDPTTGSVMTPVYFTSTYVQEGFGIHKGYEYGRTHNLTRSAVEANLATLEGGKYGIAFGSGLAAAQAILELLSQGDHLILGNNVYGGTYRLVDKVMTRLGLLYTQVDTADLDAVKTALRPNTRLVMLETPTNPMLGLTDISAVRSILKEAHSDAILAIDNTFASPYNQLPLDLGADLVWHSTTKYLNGHSDSIGGIVITDREDISEKIRFLQNAGGAIMSPMDAWLILRGTKTLHLRMAKHNENAQKIANWLSQRSDIPKVYFPGLPSHPQYELAKKQMKGFSGMVSFDTLDNERTRRIGAAFKIFTLAESLGGVESLVCHPATMTHASVPLADRTKLGLTDSLLRLSVGVEDIEDLIADLEQALKA